MFAEPRSRGLYARVPGVSQHPDLEGKIRKRHGSCGLVVQNHDSETEVHHLGYCNRASNRGGGEICRMGVTDITVTGLRLGAGECVSVHSYRSGCDHNNNRVVPATSTETRTTPPVTHYGCPAGRKPA